jgi:ABC-type glycerol-3-phosphate transport system substrate-binding protein
MYQLAGVRRGMVAILATIAFLVVLIGVLGSVTPGASTSTPVTVSTPSTAAARPSLSPRPSPSASASPAEVRFGVLTTPIRWLVSLPADASADQIAVIETVEADFDGEQLCRVPTSEPVFSFSVEIVPEGTASQVLRSQIAAGNPPDLVGPVSPAFLAASGGSFDELTPFASLSSDLRFAAVVGSKTHDRILQALTFLVNREDLAVAFDPGRSEAGAGPTSQVHRWPACH